MLIDGLNLTSTASVSGLAAQPPASGTIFPIASADGELFKLTDIFEGNAPGMYVWNSAGSEWVAADANSLLGKARNYSSNAPADSDDAPPRSYVDTAVSDALSAANTYADALALGLDQKNSVLCATTTDHPLSGLGSVDGVDLTIGARVLAKSQLNAAQNGIYVAASGAWSRATDANTSAKVSSALFVVVEQGTVSGGKGFILSTPNPIVLGTTALSFAQFPSASTAVPYDIASYVVGKPAAQAAILDFVAVRSFALPIALSGSQAKASAAATASTVFTVAKNGTTIGTMTFAASGTVATFAAATATSFVAGDRMTVKAPAAADATLADFTFTFAALS